MFLLVITLAAAEASVGLALLIQLTSASGRWMWMPPAGCADDGAVDVVVAADVFVAAGRHPDSGRCPGRAEWRASAVVGVASVGLAALATAWVGWTFHAGDGAGVDMTLWTWISVGDFQPTIGLRLDGLSLTMLGDHYRRRFPDPSVRRLVHAR